MKIPDTTNCFTYYNMNPKNRKTGDCFELRKNDRNYSTDDELVLHEYDTYLECITNRTIEATIDYIFGDAQFGLKDGYCILGLKYLHNEE